MNESLINMNHVFVFIFIIVMIIFVKLVHEESNKELKVAFAALGLFSLSCFVGIVVFVPF